MVCCRGAAPYKVSKGFQAVVLVVRFAFVGFFFVRFFFVALVFGEIAVFFFDNIVIVELINSDYW